MPNPYITQLAPFVGDAQPRADFAQQLAQALNQPPEYGASGSGGSGVGGGAAGLLGNAGVIKNVGKLVKSLFSSPTPLTSVAAGAPIAALQPAGTYGSLGALGGNPSGLGQFGSFGAATPAAGTPAASLAGALATPAYTTSPAVAEAIGANIPDAAAPAATSATSAPGASVGSMAAPAALAAAWLYGLGRAFSTDKFNDTPMGQLNVTNQSGPAGQAVYNSMTSTAAKYGDINDPATWNIAKWSPEDQKAVNYGNVGLTQPKHGKLLSN